MFSHDLTLPGSQAQSLHSNFARKLSETSVDWALPLQMSHWATWMSESCGPDRGLRFYDLPKSWILIDWHREDLQETLVLPFMRLSCRCSLHPILRRFLLYVHIHDLHWFTLIYCIYTYICMYIYICGCGMLWVYWARRFQMYIHDGPYHISILVSHIRIAKGGCATCYRCITRWCHRIYAVTSSSYYPYHKATGTTSPDCPQWRLFQLSQ